MVSSGVQANGLKPESERTFNSEVKLFLARKKKHFRKIAGWNEQFRGICKLEIKNPQSVLLCWLAVCRARQQVSEIQHLAHLLFQK